MHYTMGIILSSCIKSIFLHRFPSSEDTPHAISRETFSFQPQDFDKTLLPDFLKHLKIPVYTSLVTLAIPAGTANPRLS